VSILAVRRRIDGGERAAVSDEDLVRLISSGERTAFVVLMRRYDQLLYRTARSILRDDAEAEDALQQSYLLAYRGIAEIPKRGEAVDVARPDSGQARDVNRRTTARCLR
jgi:hypothetical protein